MRETHVILPLRKKESQHLCLSTYLYVQFDVTPQSSSYKKKIDSNTFSPSLIHVRVENGLS